MRGISEAMQRAWCVRKHSLDNFESNEKKKEDGHKNVNKVTLITTAR